MNIELRPDIPVYLLVIFALVSAGLSYLMYRKIDVVSSPRRIFLGCIRGIAFFFLFLSAFNLVTELIRFKTEKHNLVLLIDDSKSMSIRDGKIERSSEVNSILNSPALDKLRKTFNIRPVVFGGRVLGKMALDSLRFDRPATNIAAALEYATNLDINGNTALGLLITDGNYNAGGSPAEVAGALSFPLYTIGIGDSTEPKDVILKQIVPAPSIYAGKKNIVKALIGSSGFGGMQVTARLLDDGKEIDSRQVVLPGEGNTEVTFEYTPTSPGTHLLKVYVPPIQGESDRRNNSIVSSVDVRKAKYSILLVAGEPSSDVSFLRRNIETGEDFNLEVLIQKDADSFAEKNWRTTLARKFDAVVLCDFPNEKSAGIFQEVKTLLLRKDEPYIYFSGNKMSVAKLAEVPRIPFVAKGFQSGEYQVGVSPAPAESVPLSLQQTYTLIASNATLFPPLYYERLECSPQPGASALAYPVINGARFLSPLLIIDPGTQSAAVLAYGIWRLQLMSSLSGLRSDFLRDFVSTVLKNLIEGGKQKLLTLRTAERIYDPTQTVRFNALLVSEEGIPVNDADVEVSVINDSSHRIASQLRLTSMGDGSYEGEVNGIGPGKYTFTGKALTRSTFAGADSGTMVVEPLNTEFIQTKLNVDLLRQLAAITGGEFMSPSEFIHDGIGLKSDWTKPLRSQSSTRFEFLSSLPALFVVLFLLAFEWVIRKIWGLP